MELATKVKVLLHAGCGSILNKPPHKFASYREVRLDCNPQVKPNIVASIVAMPMIKDSSYDAINCCHTLEHLFCHEVAMALCEFKRVLKPGGQVHIQVPDLQSIGGKIALDQADHVIYQSNSGPVTPLDMLYGHRAAVGAGNLFMGHHTGFTSGVLRRALESAGFQQIEITRENQFELFGVGFKEDCDAKAPEPNPAPAESAAGDPGGQGSAPGEAGSGLGEKGPPLKLGSPFKQKAVEEPACTASSQE
jgi:predicted SAM-dependent methyltransferase